MKSLLTYFMIIAASALSAQTIDKAVTAPAGDKMANAEIILGFTIGEPIVGFVVNELSIDQGFWAGLLQVENITEQKDLNGIAVYPNPVANQLTIFTDTNEINGITLFGVDGKRVFKQKVEATQLEHKIDLSYLSKGVYVLRLFMKDNTEGKLFKIIKN